MIKEILTYPKNKDILTQVSAMVEIEEIKTEQFQNIIKDLIDTLNNDISGCGIAAIQIGVAKKLCIIKYNKRIYVMINPEISRTRGETIFKEGCLSVPNKYTEVKRAEKIWINYIDENGNYKEIAQGGLFSIIVQHEIEHFDGKCKLFEIANEEDK